MAIRRDKPANGRVIRPRGVPVQPGGLVLDLAGELAVRVQATASVPVLALGLVAHPVESGEAAFNALIVPPRWSEPTQCNDPPRRKVTQRYRLHLACRFAAFLGAPDTREATPNSGNANRER